MLKKRAFGDFVLKSGKYRRVFHDTTYEHVLRVARSAPKHISYSITPIK